MNRIGAVKDNFGRFATLLEKDRLKHKVNKETLVTESLCQLYCPEFCRKESPLKELPLRELRLYVLSNPRTLPTARSKENALLSAILCSLYSTMLVMQSS